MEPSSSWQPVSAGVVAALVGFTSSFAVVLTGLRAVGATPEQAASGLLALCVTQGVGTIWLASRYRRPITLAWSTPGAALLAGAATIDGGWPAAVGAFLVVAALIALTAAMPVLGRLVAAIPPPIAQAMLAGIVLPLCLAPVTATVDHPAALAPVLAVWLLVLALRPRWAVPAALAAALVVAGIAIGAGSASLAGHRLAPHVSITAPTLTWQAVVGIALPLYVVTMASQNVPGVAVLRTFGYETPWRPALAVTAIGTAVGATAGGHTINLAAISAALSASPDAGRDPRRRWIAAMTVGWTYLVLALASSALAAIVLVAPHGLVQAAAGIALLGTLGSALHGALGGPDSESGGREAALVTFVVAASGTTVAGIGAAFWALIAGLVVRQVLTRRYWRSPSGASPSPER